MRISKSEIKFLRSLRQKKVREVEKKFIVEGWRPLKDALNSGFRMEYVALTAQLAANPDHQAIIAELGSRKVELKELNEIELRQVSDTVHAQGVIALVEQKQHSLDKILSGKKGLFVYADHISDPGNVGSIVRTCDWFGVDALLLSEGCVELYNEKVVRSTSGSIFHIPVIEHVIASDLLPRLKALGFWVVATAGDSKSGYLDVHYGEKNVIAFGSEASGVSKEVRQLSDEVVKIPQRGRAESLNVGVACGIVLSHISNMT
jgi:TrmH family RNA methyltransferase